MSDFVTGIKHIGPSYPVKPVQPVPKDRETGNRSRKRQEPEAPAPDEDDDAFETTRRLALEEGLFMGMSSGAAVHVAMNKARELNDGTIVVILPDRGDRYLSTSLFASVCADCPP